jgi:hypothetical protein
VPDAATGGYAVTRTSMVIEPDGHVGARSSALQPKPPDAAAPKQK